MAVAKMLINSLIAINLGFDLPFARLSVGYLFFEMRFSGGSGERVSIGARYPLNIQLLLAVCKCLLA